MLFSGIADARAELFGCWRCQKRKLPTTNTAIATEAAMIRTGLRDGAGSLATGTKSVSCVGIVRRFGLSELTKLSSEKIYNVDLLAVFHFAFAKVIKMRPPMFKLLQVFRDPL